MKINWGTKLAFFAILFMSFVVFMVVKISQTDMPLVDENYYEKGIDYQQNINNSQNSESRIRIFVGSLQAQGIDPNAKFLFVNKLSMGDTILVKAFFYRASDKLKDFSKNLSLIDSIPAAIDITTLDKGKWKLSLTWEENNTKHLVEKEIER